MSSINAPRHHVKMFGYTLARGDVDGIDVIWYGKGGVDFDSSYIETGPFWTLVTGGIIVIVASFLALLGAFGFLIALIFMFWACDIWTKLFWF